MRKMLKGFAFLVALTLATLPVQALEITSNAHYDVDPHGSNSDGPYLATSGDVFSYVDFGFFSEVPSLTEIPQNSEFTIESFGQAFGYAHESGALSAGAVASNEGDSISMDFHGSTTWANVFTNSSGGALAYDFDFLFTGGFMGLLHGGGTSMLNLDIQLDGTSIFSRSASLIGSPGLGTVVFDSGGLSHTVVNDNPSIFDVELDPFAGTLNLGTVNSGDSFELTYIMEVWASTDDPFGYADVRVGDPFGVGFSGTLNPHAPIPEPTSMALLGLGLVGLGARRMRKAR